MSFRNLFFRSPPAKPSSWLVKKDSPETEEDYYAILSLEKTASSGEIGSAYRRLARNFHPDKDGDSEQFMKLNKAYEILSNPAKKKVYDYQRGLRDANPWRDDSSSCYAWIRPPAPSDDIQFSLFQGDIYYLIGNPILIKKSQPPLHSLFFRSIDSYVRNDITETEIFDSFKKSGPVIIFPHLHDAEFFVRARRINDIYRSETCLQSAIARVEIVADLELPPSYAITSVHESRRYFDFLRYDRKGNELTHTILDGTGTDRCFEIDARKLSIKAAFLPVFTRYGSKNFPEIKVSNMQTAAINRRQG